MFDNWFDFDGCAVFEDSETLPDADADYYEPMERSVEEVEQFVSMEQKMRWRANDTRRIRHGKTLGGNHGYRKIVPLDSPRIVKIEPVAVFVEGRRFNL